MVTLPMELSAEARAKTRELSDRCVGVLSIIEVGSIRGALLKKEDKELGDDHHVFRLTCLCSGGRVDMKGAMNIKSRHNFQQVTCHFANPHHIRTHVCCFIEQIYSMDNLE